MSQGQILDTTYTKIFVGNLSWHIREEGLRSYFQQFGEIIHVNVVCDTPTNLSKGYGFVTFKDAASATRACMNPFHEIGDRVANCNLASGRHVVRYDDLCYMSQSFMQNQHQPYWNNYYQQYNQQWLYYPVQLCAPQFGPYPALYWSDQSINVPPIENVVAPQVLTSSSSTSTPRPTVEATTTNLLSDESKNN